MGTVGAAMTSSPEEAVPDTDSEGGAGVVDSLGSIVTITPAVSPFERVTEVPSAGFVELQAAIITASEKRMAVRDESATKRLNALRYRLFIEINFTGL